MTTSKSKTAQQTVTVTVSGAHDSYATAVKGKSGWRRIIKAAHYSKDGLVAAYRNEAAFRQMLYLNIGLMVLLVFMPFGVVVKMLLVFVALFSLIVELFNTGIEACVDRMGSDFHPLAKIAKDVGSAAQMLTLGAMALLWLMAFFT